MALDFAKLARAFTVTVPVLGNSFTLNKKKYTTSSLEDGWWKVEIEGNKATGLETHYWVDLPKGSITGYTYSNHLLFSSFDMAKRKFGAQVKAPLHYNEAETFTPVRALHWEDGRFYSIGVWYEDSKCIEVKQVFDAEGNLSELKGVTPEVRTLYLFHDLERQQLRALLAAQEAEARRVEEATEHQRRMADIGYRLRHTLEQVGARLINFSRSGQRLVVDWQLVDGDYRYNSVLDAESLRTLEAGFCMSGADRQHSATSMVLLAEDYEQRGVTYITRR